MLHVVLFEPEIPHNTGNIMRTCAATGAKLHLIEPLGFSLDEKNIKRCSTGYDGFTNYEIYSSYNDFKTKSKGHYIFVTRYGKKTPNSFDFKKLSETKDIYLIFGKESSGLPLEILKDNLDQCTRIPMVAEVRSLNVSNTVAIVLYETLRQLDYEGLAQEEVQKGENYIYK